MTLPTVALDATLWDAPTTGIGLHTREIGRALVAAGVSVVRVGAERSGERPRRVRSRTLHTIAELPRVLAELRAPVYHALGNVNLPLTRVAGTRYVLTVHDLIPLTLPETVSRPFHWQFRLWLQRSLALADHVVCVSAYTRRRLLDRFPQLEPTRVSVAHNGVDHVPPPILDATSRRWLDALGLPPRFLLYAGALDARKNVDFVLDAIERFAPAERPTLVLVGQSWFGASPLERRIAALRARGFDLRPLGYQPEPLLHALMQRATLFVFPSREEGFGLPPLEAMSLGTPALVSTAGALAEVCGDAAVQVSPDVPDDLVAALRRLLADPDELRVRGEAGRLRARQFTWKAAAEHLRGVYADLA